MYVYNMYSWCPWSSEEGRELFVTGVADGCVPPRGCW